MYLQHYLDLYIEHKLKKFIEMYLILIIDSCKIFQISVYNMSYVLPTVLATLSPLPLIPPMFRKIHTRIYP